MRRTIGLALIIAVLFSMWGAAGAWGYAVAPDVYGRACARDVAKLQYVGVIGGYPDGTFRPDSLIRRSEIAKIIVACKGLTARAEELTGTAPFPDVGREHWASGFVSAAVETGIIQGYTDGLFRPDNNVTYAEALTMIIRAVGRAPLTGVWPDNYVAIAVSLGLTEGLTFWPGVAAPRGDVAMLTSRAVFGVTVPATGKTLGQGLGVSATAQVHFIDVGEGDAALVVTQAGNAILIDGGPSEGVTALINHLRSTGITSLNAVVVSHAYTAHIAGISAALAEFDTGMVYDPGYPYPSNEYQSLLTYIGQRNIPYQVLRAASPIVIDPWVDVAVLHPRSPLGPDIQDNSAVLKVTFGEVSFLFAGDIGAAGEAAVLTQSVTSPRATVLKVPDHGSANRCSDAFLQAVAPEMTVISTGLRNPFANPAVSTLKRITEAGATFYRTDLDGTVVVTTDGQTYSVATNPVPPVEPPTGFVGDMNTKHLHTHECRYLPAMQYRVPFATVDQALAAGYFLCPYCWPQE